MPTWDYECTRCHIEKAWSGSLDDRPDALICTACGSFMRRCWRAANFIIHGFKAANGYSKDPT